MAFTQLKKVSGIVRDKQSDEPIPFASAVFKLSGQGMLTDSLGRFSLAQGSWHAGDTLQIISIGYKTTLIPITAIKDSAAFTVKLELLPSATEVVVKSKYNRALWFWNKIMEKKPIHDKLYWDNYSYEIYNKLELDLENINTAKLGQKKLLKPLSFVFTYIDSTSEDKPFLPAYITETLSDYYHQNNPTRSREVIKATRTNGIDNESLIKQLGGMYQNVNIYGNFIPVFNKQFVSPFNDNGDNYYNFKLLDTQYLNKKRLVHLRFTPKHKGADVFEGDCWVHDTTYSIQKITMRPAEDANINFISGLSLIQEFKMINDTMWFLFKDKFVVDIAPLGKSKLAMKGRKTATYKNILLNDPSVLKKLNEAKRAEQVDLLPNVEDLPDSFWVNHRHETLNKSEQTVYAVLDTLTKNPTYIHYRNTLQFLSTGVKDIGNIRIGPWVYWISGNQWEGTRMRFDLSTNRDFSTHWYLHGYTAYGFKDASFKGLAEIKYEFKRQPWSYFSLSYKNDLDNGQMYHDQLGSDNVFGAIFRRPGIPYKFQRIEEKKLEYYGETNIGFGFGLNVTSKEYTALLNLPGKELYTSANGHPFNSFETGARIRFAYLERTVAENFRRTSLGSDYPIVELRYAHGWKDVLNSSYTYDKIDISAAGYLKIPPYGKIYYNFFAGKIFGTLPYQLLEIHPGNELYYYNKYAFNLMNRFEYISDQYAGFNLEHNIGNGLFRLLSITRKLKFRQLWEARGVVGNLSDANKLLNYTGNYPFKSLDSKMYLELGTGVDNIFKFFRIDFLWRVAPTPQPKELVNKFGIFGSFRFTF